MKKNDTLRVRITGDLKNEFFLAAERNHTTPSQLITSFIAGYNESNKI